MLFIAHDSAEPDLEHAATIAQKYGFVELEELRGGKLQPDVLKTDAYKGFSCFHQQALDEGTSFIYYPNHED